MLITRHARHFISLLYAIECARHHYINYAIMPLPARVPKDDADDGRR